MDLLQALIILALLYLLTRMSQLDKSVKRLQQQLTELTLHKAADTARSRVKTTAPDLDLDPIELKTPADLSGQQTAHSGATVKAEPATSFAMRHRVFDQAVAWLKRYFTEGNLIVRAGLVVLFFGVAFLLRYANQHSVLSDQFKMLSVAALGVTLLSLGWWLRTKRLTYGLILQGGGLGVLYMTVFASLRLLHLIPPPASFTLLLLIVVLSAFLALVQNSKSLAVMAVSGGFLAPILSASGTGDHIILFSYYAMLNLGIVAIAWFKSWRSLNLLGFVFTFVIASAWAVLQYKPSTLPSAQFFLILFFLFYVLIAILFARRQPPNLKGYVDASLVFGVPLVGFGLQSALVHEYAYGLAYSAFIVGAFYSALYVCCKRFGGATYTLLSEAYLSLAVVFLSLTVPFALSGEWVASVWALEGVAVLWISLRQKRQLGAIFALALQGFSGLAWVAGLAARDSGAVLLNSVFLAGVLLALSTALSSYLLRHYSWAIGQFTQRLAQPLLIFALSSWFINGASEIFMQLGSYQYLALLLFVALSCASLGALELKLQWHELRYSSVGLLIFMLLSATWASLNLSHPGAQLGWFGWPIALVVYALLLRLRDHQPLRPMAVQQLHTLGWILLALLATWEFYWLFENFLTLPHEWSFVALMPVSVTFVWLTLTIKRWPFNQHFLLYLNRASLSLIAFMLLWSLLANGFNAEGLGRLPYLPLLNLLDAAQLAVLITLGAWWRAVCLHNIRLKTTRWGWGFIAGFIFLWCNAMLLRSLHHWFGLDYQWQAIQSSVLAQAALSVLWTLSGLSLMLIATFRHWRDVWLAAAALLLAVIAKLFLFDLYGSNTLETILSFIVVGILLLIVGYFSPLPPKTKRPQ